LAEANTSLRKGGSCFTVNVRLKQSRRVKGPICAQSSSAPPKGNLEMFRWGIAALAATALCACAGRSPAPVSVVQPQDRYMDCAAIMVEVQSNNEKVQQLASDQGLKTAQNVAAGVAGFVVPILWFGMDFQGTADKETQALQARQQYLGTLAEQKRCGAEPEPPHTRTMRPQKRQAPTVTPPPA
jgi:hypothetical protein